MLFGSTIDAIADQIASYFRLPFAAKSLPGWFAEAVVAEHYRGRVLSTRDFVDVISGDGGDNGKRIGWQVKSTMTSTTVTWKRVKIEGSAELIQESDDRGDTQTLGNLVIEACNLHAQESLKKHELRKIRYARIIAAPGQVTYFERDLIDENRPVFFDPSEFEWEWSEGQDMSGKERLKALHGYRISKDEREKWFAWHGRGENQLHFMGEKCWWPGYDRDTRGVTVPKYGKKRSWTELNSWLRDTC